MEATGYIQPIPATADLWRQLAIAKAAKDRREMGCLSDAIHRATREAKRQETNASLNSNRK